MPTEQILIGVLFALLCLAGLWKDRWFLENTTKGERLADKLGAARALWVLRILFLLGLLFGALLATNVIRPVQW